MCTCNKLLTLCDCDVTDCDDHAMSRNIVRFCVHNCHCYCDATAIWLRPEINVFIFLPGCTRLQPITMREGISTGMVPTLFLLSLPAHGFLVCLNSVIQTTVYICHPLYSKKWHPAAKAGEDKIHFVPTFSEVGGDMSHGSHVVAAPTAVHVVYHHQVLSWLSVLTKM